MRQFNDTIRDVFATTPRALRAAAARTRGAARTGSVTLRLPYREPMELERVLDFLGAHAIPGVEQYRDGVFTRVLRGEHGPALVSLSPGDGAVVCEARLHDLRDLVTVVARVRHLLDLDADPVATDDALGRDEVLAPLVRKHPGLRAPGTVDGFETAVRTVVGQQISVRGSRTVLGRIVAEHGHPAFADNADNADNADGWRLFPSADTLAAADPALLPMPRARGAAVVGLAAACASGAVSLDPGADRDDVRRELLALRGIGPWSADYLLMRTTGHPDVLLSSDLVVRRAAADLGVPLDDGRPHWAPWRTYATYHLWAHLYADVWSTP